MSTITPLTNESEDNADPVQAGAMAAPFLIVTGMSGAGKTTALKALEDIGYECIDHVPLYLLPRIVTYGSDSKTEPDRPLAVGVDVRTRDFSVETFSDIVDQLTAAPRLQVRLVFLFCDDEELRRRYTVTRHRHPLAIGLPLSDGIARERRMMAPLRARADVAIDTSHLGPNELKRLLDGHFALCNQAKLIIHVMSFSFRSGLPREADLVFDVRFLRNPYYEAALTALTGEDQAVADFIVGDPAFEPFFSRLTALIEPLLSRYAAEGKSYLTIAFGCTGGRHRSVFTTERFAAWLTSVGQGAQVHHRDLVRSAA